MLLTTWAWARLGEPGASPLHSIFSVRGGAAVEGPVRVATHCLDTWEWRILWTCYCLWSPGAPRGSVGDPLGTQSRKSASEGRGGSREACSQETVGRKFIFSRYHHDPYIFLYIQWNFWWNLLFLLIFNACLLVEESLYSTEVHSNI